MGYKKLTGYPSIDKKHIKNAKRVREALDDIERNHNHSWYKEIMLRNEKNLNRAAIFYRGREITYAEMNDYSGRLASALKKESIGFRDEIIVCMSNLPETVYLMLAASRIGAVLNFVGEGFETEYLNTCIMSRKILFISDDKVQSFSKKVDIKSFDKCIITSLTDSLPENGDRYYTYDDSYYRFENKAIEAAKTFGAVLFYDFINCAMHGECVDDQRVNLNTEFTITYTSGSTKIGYPKGIIHVNRSYIAIGRFHDPDLSLMPAMRNMRGLAHIPTHSNTDIVSCISDTLMQTCTVACEPIYDQRFFARSLVINKPGFVAATRSFWLTAMKQFSCDELLEGETLPFIINAVAVGEDIAPNEERYINNCFRKLQAGKGRLPSIIGPATISVGGGNCEHGGLFFTLLKGSREKIDPMHKDYGLKPFQLCEIAVLHEDGTECEYNEAGILVANSPCTMKEYRGNDVATKKFFTRDAYGRIWGNCNVWAYIDKRGNVHMRGRVGSEVILADGQKVPLHMISDEILKHNDVLSCETVLCENSRVVSFVELLPDIAGKNAVAGILRDAVIFRFGTGLTDKYDVIMLAKEETFALTKSGKRNIASLEKMVLDNR